MISWNVGRAQAEYLVFLDTGSSLREVSGLIFPASIRTIRNNRNNERTGWAISGSGALRSEIENVRGVSILGQVLFRTFEDINVIFVARKG